MNKEVVNSDNEDRSPSGQIDAIIHNSVKWEGVMLASLRKVIRESDVEIIEEVKWKKRSNPSGVPVWSYNGIICIGNVLKNSVRLTFSKGAQIRDPMNIFNSRLDSKTVRAVDFYRGDIINKKALMTIVQEAVNLNIQNKH